MLADKMPPKVRRAIYTLLGVAFAIEAVWDVVPGGVESRIVATLAALGFTLARGNTPKGSA